MTPWEQWAQQTIARPAHAISTLHVWANTGLFLCLDLDLVSTDFTRLVEDCRETLAGLPPDAIPRAAPCRANWRHYFEAPWRTVRPVDGQVNVDLRALTAPN